jgi:hypothetical protein
MAQNQSRNSSSNKYAKELRTPKYKSRVIQSKKVYTRKGNKNEFNTKL